MKKTIVLLLCLAMLISVMAQRTTSRAFSSPGGKMKINLRTTGQLTWSVSFGDQTVINYSPLSMTLATGEVLGQNQQIVDSKLETVNEAFSAVAYKKDRVQNHCNQYTLVFKGGYGVVFRAYDDAVAYRFFTTRKEPLVIQSEEVAYHFDKDYQAYIPHTSDLRGGERYSCSFEEFYTHTPLSKFGKDTLGYLPLLVELDAGRKAVLLEADVQDYPEMFVQSAGGYSIKAVFAGYPVEEALHGINYLVKKRADYIAKTDGRRNFPWRVMVVSEQDKDLLNNDIVQKLSEPCKIQNTSWIKPGKVAWDWWNNWNISKVDFKAGINTPTYKYYIDFAAANKIEYIVLDEGWSDDWDLNKLSPAIDLKELLEYGKQKNVGLILWATWYALMKDPEAICAKYAAMGVKGFKVDFLDRNDQKVIASCYTIAAIAARHQLLLDFHGMFPAQGLQRTWPNVINFEGVRGLEYMKWHADERTPAHEVTIPFIRMMAGPMDYTPGAMRNATKGNARPHHSLPMSMGTRCRQLAMYVVYEAPLEMLADNPTAYMKEQECTDFVTRIPTTFSETIALDGKVGEYAMIARKKDNAWYIGALTDWNARDVTIDLSFLGEGGYQVEIFRDGINADRDATDYKREIRQVNASQKLDMHLAPGGGFAMRITKL